MRDQPADEDDKFPVNIWWVVGNVGCDTLTYNAKSKITVNAVLFEIHNFLSWFEDSLCKEIMDTVFQMQQKKKQKKNDDTDDETALFIALKHVVVSWKFLILEELT